MRSLAKAMTWRCWTGQKKALNEGNHKKGKQLHVGFMTSNPHKNNLQQTVRCSTFDCSLLFMCRAHSYEGTLRNCKHFKKSLKYHVASARGSSLQRPWGRSHHGEYSWLEHLMECSSIVEFCAYQTIDGLADWQHMMHNVFTSIYLLGGRITTLIHTLPTRTRRTSWSPPAWIWSRSITGAFNLLVTCCCTAHEGFDPWSSFILQHHP